MNYIDYKGPPCSLRIIKKGYPGGGELCSNVACKYVWAQELAERRGERRECGAEPVSFPP